MANTGTKDILVDFCLRGVKSFYGDKDWNNGNRGLTRAYLQ